MLVLTRKAQEQIRIGENITITIVRIKGRSVRIGIDAPDQMRIIRGELAEVVTQFEDADEAESDSPAHPRGELPPSGLPHESSNGSESSGNRCLRDSVPSMSSPPSRIPGANRASLLRTPSRLGPASLRSFGCR